MRRATREQIRDVEPFTPSRCECTDQSRRQLRPSLLPRLATISRVDGFHRDYAVAFASPRLYIS